VLALRAIRHKQQTPQTDTAGAVLGRSN